MKTLSHDPNAILASGNPFQLLLAFVRDVGAADIREGWNDGFARNSTAQLPALRDRIQMLNGWMTNISSGQRMTFTFKPGAGVAVDVNGVPKGTIKGDDFAKAFLAIWLGPEAPNASVLSPECSAASARSTSPPPMPSQCATTVRTAWQASPAAAIRAPATVQIPTRAVTAVDARRQ